MVDNLQGIGGNFIPRPVGPVRSTASKQAAPQRVSEDQDRVEISELARLMGKISQLPAVREEKIAQVKAAIASGTYQTPDKLNIAVDRLIEDLLSE